ncbi:MAG: heparinase II/III family protein [Verrucomicrobiota bacterium]
MRDHLLPSSLRHVAFVGIFGLAGLWPSGRGAAVDAPPGAPPPLSEAYPLPKLAQILLPRDRWQPFPAFTNRADWAALPDEVAKHLVRLGEESLKSPFPSLPASLYLGYAREGNRSNFEGAYFERRAALQNLVLAECVEANGRFLDAAVDACWAICEESSWCLPAHVGVQRARTGLPDVTEPIVDLFAGETAVTMAWTLYLLESELDRVSPRVSQRVALELQRRVLSPVLERDDFGWMALHVASPDRRPNNWTPWIAASVLTTALVAEPDSERRALITFKMLRSIDGFLKFYPRDGSCDEGPSYWGRAGGSLLDCLDILHGATRGQLDVFADSLVQEIGRFIYRAFIAGDYFVPMGDCPARFQPERDVVFRYGRRIRDPHLVELASFGATVSSILEHKFLGRQLDATFDAAQILAARPAAPPLLRDVWLSSEDLQLMTARGRDGSTQGLYLAAWGGHNAQSHNHNDVGNFLVFADGQPVFIDVGAPTYTAQTFSSKRYDIWAFQSAFHNLPTINGVGQGAGRSFAATRVVCQSNDAEAQLQMDIAPAYPASAHVKSWLRTLRLNRGGEVTVTESFELAASVAETSLNLMTPLEADTSLPGRIRLRSQARQGPSAIQVQLEYEAEKLSPRVERIDLADGRLARSWGTHVNRLIFQARSAPLKDTWILRASAEQPGR